MKYSYEAIDRNGQVVSGELSAGNLREAARQLERRGVTTVRLDETRATRKRGRGGRVRQADVLLVLHEFATLLESGIPLAEAVQALGRSSHHELIRQEFEGLSAQLRKGTSLSAALRNSQLELPVYIRQLVMAGEKTGKLAQALRDGVEQMEYERRISNEMRNAMVYPAILVLSGIAAILIIFTVVVPRFAVILGTGSAEVPWLGRAVIGTGMFVHGNIAWIAALGVVLIVAGIRAARRSDVRIRVMDFLSRVPVLGAWIVEAETGRWASMLATLLENRVAMLDAMELAREGVRLGYLRSRLGLVTQAVRGGAHLSQALEQEDALSATGINLVQVGERTGNLASMLGSLARLYEDSGRNRMKRVLLLIEPAAILVIGAIIGLIITGVVLVITSVNEIPL